jgi:hypothetical protein
MVSCPAMVTMRYAAGLHAAAICLWTCSIMASEPPGLNRGAKRSDRSNCSRHAAPRADAGCRLPADSEARLARDASRARPDFCEVLESPAKRPDAKGNRIYLAPLGEFVAERSPSIETPREFAAAYFQMKMLAPVTFERLASRTNRMTKRRQILTGDILSLFKTRLPCDAFCLLSITMEDLYPGGFA